MPGIAGVVYKSGAETFEAAHASMLALMQHESFYVTGSCHEPDLNVRLGWVVHEQSFSDCMPVVSERRNLVLVFYGEHFAKGTGTHGARQVLDLYEKKGESFLADLNGWFTGVLVDLSQGKTFLFNDRYGMQRLYVHESKDALFFCTEAKSLLQVQSSRRELDREALAEFVAFDCVLGDKSLYRDISLLPGGSCWTFDRAGSGKKQRYYRPEMLEAREPIPQERVIDELEKVIADVLPAYTAGSQPMALSLTGGLDTRLIVAAVTGAHGLPAYTFAGERDTLDVRTSRQISAAAGLHHQVIRLDRDFFREFSTLAEQTVYMSDGTLGLTGTHNLYFNRIARKVAPVRLTGQFGSEVVRQGRILSDGLAVDGLFEGSFAREIEEARRRVATHRSGHPLTAALHRDIPWRGQGVMCIEQSQITLRSPFMDNRLVEVVYGIPNSARVTNDVQLELIRRFNAQLGRILSDRGDATDRSTVMLTMARLFLYGLFKADYVYFFDMPSWMLRVESFAAKLGLTRMVFGLHKFENYRLWFRTSLSGYVREMLADRRTLSRGFFDPSFLKKAAEDHIAGKANYRNQLDQAVTLELIMRTLVESNLSTDTASSLTVASAANS